MKKLLILLMLLGAFITGAQQGLACQASFTWTADSSGIQFTNTSTGVFAGNYQWSFGDGTGSTQHSPYHMYNSNSWYWVCLTVWDSAGCQSTFCDTVVSGINTGTCQAYFTSSGTSAGNTITFNNQSTGNYIGAIWDYGDGTTGTVPSHIYTTPGNYTVCLTIGSNPISLCSDSYCATVVVQGTTLCNAQFTSIDTAGGYMFLPQVISGSYTYAWDFGDGSASTNPVPFHTYNANGYYTVCLSVYDSTQNCSTSWCDSVQVGGGNPTGCSANFSYQQGNPDVYFYGYGNTSGVGFSSWVWDFGDGTTATGQYPVHAYQSSGTYTVCLYASNFFCADTVCQVIVVNNGSGSGCNANFNVYDSAGVHYFIPDLVSSNISYHWDFGDNTSSNQSIGVHQYNGTGPFLVCLTVADSSQGCTATQCDTIYTTGNPVSCQAYFSYSSDSLGNVQFFNGSTGNYSAAQWSFGDGTGSTMFNPSHQYTSAGPYVVCLTIYGNAINGCQSTFCDTIYPGLNANSCLPMFYTYPDSNTFGNGNINFALINTCPNTTYTWDFGDGTIVTTTNSTPPPVHQYNTTGWYTVCVVATSPNGSQSYCNQLYAYRGTTGLNTIDRLDAIAYPNPANSASTIRFIGDGETILNVISLEGRLVLTQNAGNQSGEVQLPIDFSALENGIYFVQIQSGDQQGTLRVMVQH